MLTKEALRGAIIGSKLFNELEGCIELNETQPNDSEIGMNTAVLLNGEYQYACVYANRKEGYVKRLKLKKGANTSKLLQGEDVEMDSHGKKPIEETVKGDVLILFCSDKVLKLLKR